MSVDPRQLFDWYPIQRLEGMREHRELHDIKGLGSPETLRTRTEWVAIVRRIIGRDAWTGLPIWSGPEEVDLAGVQHEMERLSDGEYVFRYDLTDVDPTERIRDHINAAAESLATRTEEWPSHRGRAQ